MNSGRYGTDPLSVFLVAISLVSAVAASVWKESAAGSFLIIVSIGLLAWAIFRIMSTNVSKRREENEAFMALFKRGKSDPYKYFRCPKCHTKCRVPRGRGKIKIKCPKCGHHFIKRT